MMKCGMLEYAIGPVSRAEFGPGRGTEFIQKPQTWKFGSKYHGFVDFLAVFVDRSNRNFEWKYIPV